jgi:inorganic pyrophosphatase
VNRHAGSVRARVEIPRGSRNKYEVDPAGGGIRLDRVLFSPLHYPADYGYLEGTHAEDGDHLDVLIVTYEPTFAGCLVDVRPIGVLDMSDDKGRDQKVLAVPVGDPRFADVADLADVPAHFLKEIQHFFTVYKTLEQKAVEIHGWAGADAAWRLVADSRRRHAGQRILGLDHAQVTIPVGQEDAGRRFYCEVLGLAEVPKPEPLRGRGGFWVQVGDREVHVSVEDGVDRAATRAHLAYRVPDLDAWRVRLEGVGIVVTEDAPLEGRRRMHLRDPFGNRIELIGASSPPIA